jgi:hypothetical protein
MQLCLSAGTQADIYYHHLVLTCMLQALPRLIALVNTSPEFASLRAIYYWRLVAEWYRRQSDSYLSALRLTSIDAALYLTLTEAEGTAQAQRVFEAYVTNVREGSYSVVRVHQLEDMRKFARTYSQGCIDFREVQLTIL